MRSFWLLLFTLLISQQVAGADPKDPAQVRAARELALEGDKLMAAGDCKGALDRFARAYELVPVPTISVLQGRCLAELGKLVEAAEKFEQTRRVQISEDSPEPFREAVDEANRQLRKLRSKIPEVRIVLTGPEAKSAGAVVKMDGKEVPAALLGVSQPVNPGRHEFEVRVPGGPTTRKQVTLSKAEHAIVQLLVHGPKRATTQPPKPDAPAESNGAVTILGWGALGLGAVGLGVGTYAGLNALDSQSTLDEVCQPECPASYADELDSYRLMRTVSWVSFGVAAAGTTTGLILLLTSSDTPPEADAGPARLTPWIGPGMAGVAGRF